ALLYHSPLSLHDALPIFLFALRPLSVRADHILRDDLGFELQQLFKALDALPKRIHLRHERVELRLFLGRELPLLALGTIKNRSGDRKSTRLNSSHVKISY